MEFRKIILYIALTAVVFALWEAWQKDYPPTTAVMTAEQTSPGSANVPPISVQGSTIMTPPSTPGIQATPQNPRQIVPVRTDVLQVGIDTRGGNVVQLALPKYPQTIDTPDVPVQLFNTNPSTLYEAQSGLIGESGPDTQTGQVTFTPEKTQYEMQPNQNTMDVRFTWSNPNGLKITKIFSFQRGKYEIPVRYEIVNNSQEPWTGQFYAQLKQKPTATSNSIFSLHTFMGAAYSTPQNTYEKLSFGKMEKENLDRSGLGGWIAMQQRYFLSSWIPPQNQENHFYTRSSSEKIYTIGYVGPVITVPPGGTAHASAILYGGPEAVDQLKILAPHLDLTIDYGWLWPISKAIFWVMKHIYNWVGNWGWAIVLVTLLIKIIFYKLSETSYRSMAKIRNLTPKIQAIKDRYGDDRQKMSQATMELYKKEKVNPLSGCLPILVQIPFFIALYYVLIESVELRQAPFIFWIRDLSARDPYFVLPVLMGISMFLQQRLNPPPPDPMQAKLMMFLPAIFTVFFIAFPAGLVLYWLVNNCLSALQQWYIMRRETK